ncbi:MAG: hypothetical protein QNJ65_07395 [Xenococcaceae cyanobacterium MO_234.B1]|nr:hypothetical protein [Xenococcaceae cyanobacterium MO_234.B1]
MNIFLAEQAMYDYFESFIQLIEQQPELFTEEDREYLRQQEWSKDKDDIENEIMEWAKPRAAIYTALTNLSLVQKEDPQLC